MSSRYSGSRRFLRTNDRRAERPVADHRQEHQEKGRHVVIDHAVDYVKPLRRGKEPKRRRHPRKQGGADEKDGERFYVTPKAPPGEGDKQKDPRRKQLEPRRRQSGQIRQKDEAGARRPGQRP